VGGRLSSGFYRSRRPPLVLRALCLVALLAGLVPPAAAFDFFARHEVTAQFATPDGKPMDGAEVRVFGPDDASKVVETGRTDANGKFSFFADRDGFWSAEVHSGDQVARVMIKVDRPSANQSVMPALVLGGIAVLVTIAVVHLFLRARRARLVDLARTSGRVEGGKGAGHSRHGKRGPKNDAQR